ncbi:MAG TPA: hypothetical protein DD671_12405 [Balneolaceae bacterium]|nr:hypothetical protein [Balneola sp.]HBQ60387.1 hypothetical protein [Balneolaceae bacterium]|tara:strand:- start:346 stop:1008 length:663 start_codon:yes stop_codon:yes gene_type:complete
MKARYLFLILFLFSISACDTYDSGDLNQDRIATDYTLSYNAQTNTTRANAEFRFGNDYVELSSPASIYFNNQEMERSTALGKTWYSISIEDSVSATFEFTNQAGDVYENYTEIPPSLSIDSASLSLSSTSIVSWRGPSLKDDETVTLSIRGENGSFTARTKEVNASSIFLRAGEIDGNLEGRVIVTLTRSFEPDLVETTPEGGSLKVEYISSEIQTTVRE